MKGVYGITSALVTGDAQAPDFSDVLAQLGTLEVGQPVPEGWRVLTGNSINSQVARVVMRYEVEDEAENEDSPIRAYLAEMAERGDDTARALLAEL